MFLGLAAISALSPATGPVVWQDLAPVLGIQGEPTDPGSGIGGGVALLDADGDGSLDIVVATPLEGHRLIRQTASGFALDDGALPIGQLAGETAGVVTIDLERDGDLDLLILREGPELLLRNDAGVFTDVSASHWPLDGYWTVSAAVGDVDGDGDDDVVTANYISGQAFPAHYGSPNRLLLNDGSGHFDDVAPVAGMAGDGCSLSVLLADLDEDGDLDLLEVNDFGQFSGPDRAWRNDGLGADGIPRFTDTTALWNLGDRLYGMGAAAADYDGDQRLDLALTSIGRSLIKRGRADGTFEDVTDALGASVPWGRVGYQATWHPLFFDFDADGWLDLFETGGHVKAVPFLLNDDWMPNVLLRGGADGTFSPDPTSVAVESPAEGNARGIGLGDLDGDGAPELVIAHANGLVSLLKRQGALPAPLKVVPRPTVTGPSAAGFDLVATCGTATRRFVLAGGGGFASQGGETALWVTLPGCAPGAAVALRATWPSGYVTNAAAAMGETMVLTEPKWLQVTATSVIIAPTNVDGAAVLEPGLVQVTTSVGSVGPLSTGATGLEATVALGDAIESSLTIVVDGRPLPVHPRVRAPGRTRLFTEPRHRIAGQAATLYVVANDAVGLTATLGDEPLALAQTSDAGLWRAELPPSQGSVSVAVLAEGVVVAAAELAASPVFDVAVSRVKIGSRLWFDTGKPKPFGLVFTLRDANGVPPNLPNLDYRLEVDGQPLAKTGLNTGTSQAVAFYSEATIGDGASLQIAVDGIALGGPQTFRRIVDPAELAPEVDPARSHCGPSMATFYADGMDEVTLLVFLRDSGGSPIPSVGPPPEVVPSLGVTLFPEPAWTSDDRHQILVRAGTATGLLELPVTLSGVPVGVTCRVELLAARPVPTGFDPAVTALTVQPWRSIVGSAASEVRVRPRNAAGRLLGSGLTLAGGAGIGELSSYEYGGLGHYDALWIPGEVVGVGEVTATFGASVVAAVEVYDPFALPVDEEPVEPAEADPVEVEPETRPDLLAEPEPVVEPGRVVEPEVEREVDPAPELASVAEAEPVVEPEADLEAVQPDPVNEADVIVEVDSSPAVEPMAPSDEMGSGVGPIAEGGCALSSLERNAPAGPFWVGLVLGFAAWRRVVRSTRRSARSADPPT